MVTRTRWGHSPTSCFSLATSATPFKLAGTKSGLAVHPASHLHGTGLSTLQLKFNSTWWINHLTPNDHYMGRTAQLTSRCCILFIYSTNIRTEYFKHAAYSPVFFSSKCSLFHNATFFGSYIIHILNTGCAKI